jgi:hypothetical protein
MKRIGVTINIQGKIFSNGVNQNAIFLALLLKKCGFLVDLICSDENTIKEILNFKIDINKLNLIDSYKVKYDLIIQLGLTVGVQMSSHWKKNNPNVKFVSYECGNHYLINTEKILFNKDIETDYFRQREETFQQPDQVWSIPQMENTNYTFYQFKNRQENVTVVPFVWDPLIIEQSFSVYNSGAYQPREIQKCSVMEPNVSVMKNVVLPIVILEKNQKINPLKEIYLFGADVLKNSKPFLDFLISTKLHKDGIVSVENRYISSKILVKHVDFVFSWQWENNLNYLWLDVAWMGYPIIHNGSLCQDVGYYYEGFNGDMAIKKIDEVIKTHNDKHIDYLNTNRDIIKRYTSQNENLIIQYRKLVEDVLNDNFIRRKYDWIKNEVID